MSPVIEATIKKHFNSLIGLRPKDRTKYVRVAGRSQIPYLKGDNMNILLTSAGRRTYLVKYFQEALSGNGLVHAGNSVYSAALQAADKAVITPLIYDSSYIDFLIKYCKKNNITAILSFFDVDLPILAKSKDRFKEAGISAVVSDYGVIHICNDKWETYNFLIDNRLDTPTSFINLHNVKIALTKQAINFPLIIKPRWGMGSIGLYEAENLMELDIFYSRCKKEIFKSYLSYESNEDPENCIIIQEKKTGEEFCMEVINNLDGKYINTFVKRKKICGAAKIKMLLRKKIHYWKV